jgi:hypothetical protein
MISDDVFDRQCEALETAAQTWFAPYRDEVALRIERTSTFTRLAGRPHAPSACALDIVIDTRRQVFDMEIGSETYEDLALKDAGLVLTLFNAVARGVVVTRRWQRGLSGVHIATETHFDGDPPAATLHKAHAWPLRQFVPGRSVRDLEDALALEKRYTPWRRVS